MRIQDLMAEARPLTFGRLPQEALLAILDYAGGADNMPGSEDAYLVFRDVPATLVLVPVDQVKAALMATEEIGGDFKTFDDYHAWYVGHGDTPDYGPDDRWPCIVSTFPDEVFEDGSHRMHAYIRAGHDTIPVLRYDSRALWSAHAVWLAERDALRERG